MDMAIIAVYSLIYLLFFSKDSVAALLAMSFSAMYSHSDLFNASDAIQVHLSYSVIYLFFAASANSKLTISAMALMATLNFTMALDAYFNGQTQTWLYLNYVVNTASIHAVIVGTLVFRRKNIAIYHSVINSLRNMFSYQLNPERMPKPSMRQITQRNKGEA